MFLYAAATDAASTRYHLAKRGWILHSCENTVTLFAVFSTSRLCAQLKLSSVGSFFKICTNENQPYGNKNQSMAQPLNHHRFLMIGKFQKQIIDKFLSKS